MTSLGSSHALEQLQDTKQMLLGYSIGHHVQRRLCLNMFKALRANLLTTMYIE